MDQSKSIKAEMDAPLHTFIWQLYRVPITAAAVAITGAIAFDRFERVGDRIATNWVDRYYANPARSVERVFPEYLWQEAYHVRADIALNPLAYFRSSPSRSSAIAGEVARLGERFLYRSSRILQGLGTVAFLAGGLVFADDLITHGKGLRGVMNLFSSNKS